MSFKSPYRMFPWRRASIDTALGNIPTCYLLRDEFTTPLAAGTVNGTAAEPGPGTRTVVDTDVDALSIGGGNLIFANQNSVWGDPGYWLDAVSRMAGRFVLVSSESPTGGGGYRLGFDVDQAGAPSGPCISYNGVGDIVAIDVGPVATIVAAYVDTTIYQVALPLRSAGVFYFINGGAFANWTLIWIESGDNTATLYPTIATNNANFPANHIRVPCDLWLPSPVASDGFNDPNGTSLDAHLTDGLGHPEGVAGGLGSGGDGLAWTEVNGDWEIQGNRVTNVGVDPGVWMATVTTEDADVIIDCVVNITSINAQIIFRYSDGNNYWRLQLDDSVNEMILYENNAGVQTIRAQTGVIVVTPGVDYDLRIVCYGQTIDCYLDGANRISYGSAALNETVTVHGIAAHQTSEIFDDFVVYPRGTDGEYSRLNAF